MLFCVVTSYGFLAGFQRSTGICCLHLTAILTITHDVTNQKPITGFKQSTVLLKKHEINT